MKWRPPAESGRGSQPSPDTEAPAGSSEGPGRADSQRRRRRGQSPPSRAGSPRGALPPARVSRLLRRSARPFPGRTVGRACHSLVLVAASSSVVSRCPWLARRRSRRSPMPLTSCVCGWKCSLAWQSFCPLSALYCHVLTGPAIRGTLPDGDCEPQSGGRGPETGAGWCLRTGGCFRGSGHVRIEMEPASLSTYTRSCKGLGNEFTITRPLNHTRSL